MGHRNQSRAKTRPLDPLDRVGWLSRQPADFRTWAAENGRWRSFAAGETIYIAGDRPDGMYGLGSGALEITFPLQGEELVTIHRAEPGFWIGEAAHMAGGRARAIYLFPGGATCGARPPGRGGGWGWARPR